MATEEKSIQISYKADLKDLIANLKKIPGITDQEAKKMVAALDRQMKQAEKASKQAAAASKKAAQEASKAATRAAADFDDLSDSARRAEDRLERVAESSGDIDRGFSSIGLALRGVNPQLAEAADGLADTFAVVEGLTMSFVALNPVVVAAGVAIGALTLGYVAHQAELEAARQLTLDLKAAQEALMETQQAQEDNMVETGGKLREIQRDYQLLTGQISEYEYNLEKAGEAAEVSFLANIKAAQDALTETQNNIKMVKTLTDQYGKVGQAPLSDSEKERLRQLQLQNKEINNSLDLMGKQPAVIFELHELMAILTKEEAKRKYNLEGTKASQQEAIRLSREMVTLEKELADETDVQAQKVKKVVKAKKESKEETVDETEALQGLMDAENSYFDRQIKARQDIKTLSEKTLLSEEQQRETAFQKEIERIQELGEISGQQLEAERIINALIAEEKEEQQKRIRDQRHENFLKEMEDAETLSNAFSGFSQAVLDAAVQNGRANQKTIMALFRMNQIAAVGEIAFNTAKAVSQALTYGPVLAPAMTALAVGTGAAQSAVVMGQQPPQASFHMGGMAPDEMGARVLKGEAVLDRATVRNIGGEQGVRNLQQGASGGQVMVIQPFKHFGRFTREIGYKTPKNTGIRGY